MTPSFDAGMAEFDTRMSVFDNSESDESDNWAVDANGPVELARTKAYDNLTDALVEAGWSRAGAQALSRACVKPDEVRRRLGSPVSLRVPGGTLLVIETLVYSLAVSVYPTNLRELGQRSHPLGLVGDLNGSRAIVPPVADPDHVSELVLHADTPADLAERLRSSEAWLRRENSLNDDVKVEGVLQPLTLVGMRVDHANGAPSVHILTAADGSSRTTATHAILDVDPADIVYEFGSSERQYRQRVGAPLRAMQEKGWSGLDSAERGRLRALTAPARLVIGYQQERGRGVGFDSAIRSLIGLMHLAPPKVYGTEVERDAIADAVLDMLSLPRNGRSPRITLDESSWYSASITRDERDRLGLPPHDDIRAADIIRVFLHGGLATARWINEGVRRITARHDISIDTRVAMAVELILRTWRTAHPDDRLIAARRSALQRAYALRDIRMQRDGFLIEGLGDSEATLEILRDQAVIEASEGHGRTAEKPLASFQIELLTKAAYYLVLAEPMALRREAPPTSRRLDDDPVDQRSPSAVLSAMISTVRGVHQAYEVVRQGRAGQPLWEVDARGKRTADEAGKPIVLTDELLRATYGGKRSGKTAKKGLAGAEVLWDEFIEQVDELELAMKRLQAVPSDSGRSHIDEQGWPKDQVEEVRDRLDEIRHTLRSWRSRWDARQEPTDEGVES